MNNFDNYFNNINDNIYMNDQAGSSQLSSQISCAREEYFFKNGEFLNISNYKENFVAGKVSKNFHVWKDLTSDNNFVLNLVKGVSLNLDMNKFVQSDASPLLVDKGDRKLIDSEIKRFLKLEIIKETCDEPVQFLSSIFPVAKPAGGVRLILNLKKFNKYFEPKHFQMSSIQDAIVLMRKNCYFYKVDLCDAFYSLSVRKQDRKFLKFKWNGNLYQYTCLPMGFCNSPHTFCKVMHVPIVH